jgi:hypothetical protein
VARALSAAPSGVKELLWIRGRLYTTLDSADQTSHIQAWCMGRPSFFFPFYAFYVLFFLFKNLCIIKCEQISNFAQNFEM